MTYAEYHESYKVALESSIGGLIACRDKVGLTWQQRQQALEDVSKLMPIMRRMALYFTNVEAPSIYSLREKV